MSEASFWDYLKKVLPPYGHYSRIEADTAQGFPDVHYTINGQSGTIELKAARNPRKDKPFSGEDEGLRRSQLIWMDEEDEAGGVIWILAEVGDIVFLVNGNDYRALFNQATFAQLARYSAFDWNKRGSGNPTDELARYLRMPRENPENPE